MPANGLVIDANILIRGVFGRRARHVIERYTEQWSFFLPEFAYAEAEWHVPTIAGRRRGDHGQALRTLRDLVSVVEVIQSDYYAGFEPAARERLGYRDPDDWPILATALALNCPIWTEDSDFFGCGVATWTTRTVEIFLRE
jgi:predicted nucleic acid-binding protein